MKGRDRTNFSPLALFSLIAMVAITLGSLIYTQDLEQKNSEKIFLTEDSITSYENFEQLYSQKSIVVIQTPKADNALKAVKSLFLSSCINTNDSNDQNDEADPCQVLGPNDLPQGAKDLLRLESEQHQLQILMAPAHDPRIKKAIAKLKEKFPKAQFAGIPYTNFLLDRYSKSIKTTIFPALFASVFLLLLIGLKSIRAALVVFFPPLMASASSLLCTKIIFETSTLITSIVPLLLFIINLSLILHIHHTAMEVGDMKSALKEKREPIFLMVFTTFIGFGSLYFSKLEAISHFGILSSLLFIFTTGLCVLWPLSLSYLFPQIWKKPNQDKGRGGAQQEVHNINSILYKYTRPWSTTKITIFCALAILLGSLTYPKIPIITDATEYFPASERVKETMLQMAKEIMGTPILEVIVQPKEESFSIDDLKALNRIESKILENPHYQIISSNQLVVMANAIYAGKRKLPDSTLAYYTLLSKAPQGMAEGYHHDEGHRLTLLGGPTNIEEYEEFVSNIEKYFKGFKLSFNGLYYHLMVAQKQMIVTLFLSFSVSLTLIALCALLYFRKIKLFFIFLAVNTIPVLGSFPILLAIGNSFNVATVMTYSISLGLIVDSSFHIIHAMDLMLKERAGRDETYFYKTVIIPIVQSSVLLTFCFSFFGLSGFLPIREFGISLSIVIFLGMILDLKVLPALYHD